ncbi:hypothetical protein BC828DRAFT_409989 [Blastocladiella britannica]|nr:hypothetical protein BC828DRAFT_409989 [Blastocladiella britannica]
MTTPTALPIIAVVGATGNQGGSVVDTLLAEGKWAVRALTRNPESDAAKALIVRGATVAKVDLDEPATLSSAFAGATAVFAVTNGGDAAGAARGGPYFEEAQGKAMVDAAKAAGVKHFIWSTLANVEKVSGGKLVVPVFTAKARVEEYARAIGLPSTFVYVGIYMSQFKGRFAPTINAATGEAVFSAGFPPNSVADLADTNRDTGRVVSVALAKWGTSPVGARVAVDSEHLTWTQLVETYAQVTGKPAKYVYTPITDEDVAATPDAFKQFLDMTRFIGQYGVKGGADKTAEWVDLGVQGTSWADYIKSQL